MKLSLPPYNSSFQAYRWACRVSSALIVGAGLFCSVQSAHSLEFPSTGDRGAPSRTESGGTRSDRCGLPLGKRLSALVPQNNVNTFAGEQAAFWMHMPAELSGETAELFVKNVQTEEVVYQQQFPMGRVDTDSIVEVRLPATQANGTQVMEPNQDYFWELAVICDVSDRSRDHAVQGYAHRVVSDELRIEDLAALDVSEQAARYVAAEVWQETLESAVQLKAEYPLLWSQLLSSVDLAEALGTPVVDAPLVAPSPAGSLPASSLPAGN